jgi:hypothetical protein
VNGDSNLHGYQDYGVGGILNLGQLTISESCIAGSLPGRWSEGYGLVNTDSGTVTARNNWWGAADGPLVGSINHSRPNEVEGRAGEYVAVAPDAVVPFLTAPPFPGCPTLPPRVRFLEGFSYNPPTIIRLYWVDAFSDESGFVVERAFYGSDAWTPVATLPPDTEEYTDTGLTCGTRYQHRVAALFADGSQSAYATTETTTWDCPS